MCLFLYLYFFDKRQHMQLYLFSFTYLFDRKDLKQEKKKKNNGPNVNIVYRTEIRFCWLSQMLLVIEYIQYYDKWQCVKLLRMNMHKQPNVELCVRVYVLFALSKRTKTGKKPHTLTHIFTDKCGSQ